MKYILLVLTSTLSFTAFAANGNASAAACASAAASPAADADHKSAAADEKQARAVAASGATGNVQRPVAFEPFRSTKKTELNAYVTHIMHQLNERANNLRILFYKNITAQIPIKASVLQRIEGVQPLGKYNSLRDLNNLMADYALPRDAELSPVSILSAALSSLREELGGQTPLQFLERESKAFQTAYAALDNSVAHAVGNAFDNFLLEDGAIGAREGLSKSQMKTYNELEFEGAGEKDSLPLTYWFNCPPPCNAHFTPAWNHAYYHNPFCRHKQEFVFQLAGLTDAANRFKHVTQAIDLESNETRTWYEERRENLRPPTEPSDDLKVWELLHSIFNSVKRKSVDWNSFIDDYSEKEFDKDCRAHSGLAPRGTEEGDTDDETGTTSDTDK